MSCQAVKRRTILVGNEFFGVLMLCFGSGIFLWVSKLLFVEKKYKASPCTKQNSGALGFGILFVQNVVSKLHVRVSAFLCSYIPACNSDFCQGCIPLDMNANVSQVLGS
jgi:hypothetical protein